MIESWASVSVSVPSFLRLRRGGGLLSVFPSFHEVRQHPHHINELAHLNWPQPTLKMSSNLYDVLGVQKNATADEGK